VIVIDASALAAFLLKEPGWKDLAPYLKNSMSVDMILKEVSNTIWKACTLKGIISMSQALKIYKILESMIGKNLILEPELKYLENALNIALTRKTTVYDALYISLAKTKNLPLVTLDKKQAETAKNLGVKVIIPLKLEDML
jgi:predicted nucleic acid-binding protein